MIVVAWSSLVFLEFFIRALSDMSGYSLKKGILNMDNIENKIRQNFVNNFRQSWTFLW